MTEPTASTAEGYRSAYAAAVSRELADRIASGVAAAWRNRVRHLDGHVLGSRDGVLVCLSMLPADEQNVTVIEREPEDALAALRWAERLVESQGRTFGVELEPGRHPAVDAAVRELGMSVVVARPAWAVRLADLAPPAEPEGVTIRRVADPAELAMVAGLEMRVFGTEPDVAERMLGPSMLGAPGIRVVLATLEGAPAGFAWTSLHDGAVGIFGVAVAPELRRRGIGRAVTAFAVHDASSADLAWLQPTPMGRPLYESMGFEPVSEWEVWVRTSGHDGPGGR
jgi:ribosomal protein S18 acetylase RimI-like enzyme